MFFHYWILRSFFSISYFASHDFKVQDQIKLQVIRKTVSNQLRLPYFSGINSLLSLHIFKQSKYVSLQTNQWHHLSHQSTEFYNTLYYHKVVMNYQYARSKKWIWEYKVSQAIQGIDWVQPDQNFPKFYLQYT